MTRRPVTQRDAVPSPRRPMPDLRAGTMWDAVARDELIATIRTCAQRLITTSWVCDSVAPTITQFVDDLRSGHSTHDLPVDALRTAALAAGELVAICKVNDWSIQHALAMAGVRDELFFAGIE